MTQRARSGLLLALSVSAVAATLSVTPVHAAGSSSPELRWRPCAQEDGPAGQECAELSVPLDYGKPDGPRTRLGVSRVLSDRPEARRGTLIVIPGGPGGSGTQRLTQKGKALQKELEGAYDLIALDPRGIGGSDRTGCGLSDEDRDLVNLRPWPGPGGDVSDSVRRARRIADACARDGGPLLRSMSTANEARDIDSFRKALGEEKLSAYASSYGTYVAAQYAQKYPDRTDRWVLDSNGDPDPKRVGRGWSANLSPAMEQRFPDFARWAADPAREKEGPADGDGLRLARRAGDVRPMVIALAERLDRHPKPTTTPGKPLTGNRLRQALQLAMYSDRAFADTAQLIKDADDSRATPVLPAALAGSVPEHEAAVTVSTICNDVRWPRRSIPAAARDVAADRARYPLTGGMPAGVFACAFWKWAPAEEPTRITSDGPSNILMIQNLRDPATPYFGALKMREALGQRARLVSVDAGGHGVYLGNGNACGDRKVTDFLRTGKRPGKDMVCAG
ncbi:MULTISPECIES: alpha/beta hydrolase [Streptomyces]|uniref:alpha/beta hydrolase n=1 Tax=Streptomyces TaxID=1883 RepID=UPI00163CB9C3|nr:MULTISPECIES: alpha/beta hydrolase [Streptomyces]MBC2875353.1 alpha/beta fold hydrolase [Streptomyces sp. TYQ1024]UBI37169.1 alpha/beta hydrolase [Streptomyces mobaraensis]UKW29762.1 alpha/beta hydrolase [Streptomyces sp. TYQ1024]